jgi:hypothetical protein
VKYYAAVNSYGSETNIGFCNTWNVLAFDSRKSRDEYVDKFSQRNRSVRAILRKEVKIYVESPKPFSGEASAMLPADVYDPDESIPGLIGTVVLDKHQMWENFQ